MTFTENWSWHLLPCTISIQSIHQVRAKIINSWQIFDKNDHKLRSLEQTICGHVFYERLGYQVQRCINCTNTNCSIHVYLVSLPLYYPYSFAPDTGNLRLMKFPWTCNIAWQSWCTNCLPKTLQFQLAYCCQINQGKHSDNSTWRRLYVIWLLGLAWRLMARLLLHASVFLKL